MPPTFPIRILYYIQSLPPARLTGSEKYVLELSESMAPLVDRVDVVGTNKTGYYKFIKSGTSTSNDVDFTRLNVNPIIESLLLFLRYLSNINPKLFEPLYDWRDGFFHSILRGGHYSRAFKTLDSSKRIDLIHGVAFPSFPLWSAWKLSVKYDIPLVITPFAHLAKPDDFNRPWILSAMQVARSVIAVTNVEKKALVAQGIEPEKVSVIPLGIRISDWEVTNRFIARKFFGFMDDEIVILIPNKSAEKGCFDVLISLLALEVKTHRISVVLIGQSTLDDSKRLLKYYSRLKAKGIKIVDLGYVSGVLKLFAFKASDILAQPSSSDSFGFVYLEAWVCQVPVIGARAGAIPEVIREGRNGLLVESHNSEQLMATIESLIIDEKLRSRMGHNGFIDVKENYRFEQMVTRVTELYKTVIDG